MWRELNMGMIYINSYSVQPSWVLKTGFYNQMTAENTPFATTINTTLFFINLWELFNNNWGTWGTVNNGSGSQYIQQDLGGLNIIPTKIRVQNNLGAANDATRTIVVYVSADGTNWTVFGSTTWTRGNSVTTSQVDLVNTTLTSPIRYLRYEWSFLSGHGQYNPNECQIVEWYEK